MTKQDSQFNVSQDIYKYIVAEIMKGKGLYLLKKEFEKDKKKYRIYYDYLSNKEYLIKLPDSYSCETIISQQIIQMALKTDFESVFDDNFINDIYKTQVPMIKLIAEIINKQFHPKSLIDMGCGSGLYLAEFYKLGINVSGCDINETALSWIKSILPDINVFVSDLRKKISFKQKFDLCLCLEVAEHIEEIYSHIFVENLINSSNIIIFSASPPEQPGIYHVNEHEQEFWINLFSEKNYNINWEETNLLKKNLKNQNIIYWLVNNILVFCQNNS